MAQRHQTVLVVDFGGQYTQLIVRRVRELNVYSEMVPWMKAAERIRELSGSPSPTPPSFSEAAGGPPAALGRENEGGAPGSPSATTSTFSPHEDEGGGLAAVILSGGPASVLAQGAPTMDLSLLEGLPVLGICYGMQLMAHQLGGRVEKVAGREYGFRKLDIFPDAKLVGGLSSNQVWMSHGDQVLAAPPGYSKTASTESCPFAAFESVEQKRFGVQFHPEVSHTPSGMEVLRRFLFDHAGLKGDWTSENFIDEQVERIRAEVGPVGKVLCAVSGGVDSSVMAALLTKAIGERAVCVFVDHGLLRKNEAEQVIEAFTEHFHPNLKAFDEKDRFFGALKGETDPECKRKIIGEQFVRVFEDHANELKGCDFLAQGTLYPDVIESGSPTAAKIKTHHNVGGLPEWMRLKLIEPLRWLFKDEVRAVGRALGLPADMVDREPFPGPGLGVRILGEVTPERVKMVQEADWIFRSELKAYNARARGGEDGENGESGENGGNREIGENGGNRENGENGESRESRESRESGGEIEKGEHRSGQFSPFSPSSQSSRLRIWQSYAALLDVRSVGVMGDERTYEHPIVLRAVQSEDAMTAQAVNIPFEVLQHVAYRIVNEVEGVNRVLYDLTSKPPATIEWE